MVMHITNITAITNNNMKKRYLEFVKKMTNSVMNIRDYANYILRIT